MRDAGDTADVTAAEAVAFAAGRGRRCHPGTAITRRPWWSANREPGRAREGGPVIARREALRGMSRMGSLGNRSRTIRRHAWLGVIALALGLGPWPARADEPGVSGAGFRLLDVPAEGAVPAVAPEHLVAALTPGSVLVAQAGGGATEPADGWRFSVAPYFWMARTKMNLDVGPVSRSTTIDFVDLVPQLHMAFAAHAEGTWQRWTGFLDLFYVSVGQSETQNAISVSTNLQELFFEFGATYRLGPVSLGQAGKLTFEPLVGGRFMWVDVSLGAPNQKVSGNGSVIDPMVGGRITYHITDTLALWFRGDVAGFGISDNQSNLTYNLLGGVEWRFHPRASALVGWRYMNIDLEKGSGARTFNADIEMNGPFLGLNVHF